MNKILLGFVSILFIAGMGYLFFLNQRKTVPTPLPNITPTLSQNISPTTISQPNLGAGGNSYLDKNGVFSFLYPNDYILDTQDPNHIRIYKKGETERPQSEMSDGALMVFEPITLQGTSLESWVDTRIKEATADGTSEIIQPKKAITAPTYSGFTYEMRGLGTSKNLAVQKNTDSPYAILITYSVSDPQNKGYQKEIDTTLASLQLLK